MLKDEYLAFFAGFLIMVLEISGARVLYSVFGSSILIWTTVIGLFMAALSLGYYIGGKESNRNRISWAIALSSIITILFPLFSFTSTSKFYLLFLYGVIISIPAFALAMISPYLVGDIKSKKSMKTSESAGYIYAISTIGSILGTFIAGFLLIPTLGVMKTLLLTGAASILLSYALTPQLFKLSFLTLILIVLPFDTGIPTETFTAYIIDKGDARLLKMDLLIHSGLNLSNYSKPLFKYTEIIQNISMDRDAEKIAIIGAGGCSQYHYFKSLYPAATIYLVDIDSKVFDICREYFFVPETANFINQDGRVFLTENSGFDIIVLDAFGNSCSIPQHLATVEFFEIVKRALSNQGLVMANIILKKDSTSFNYLSNTFSYVFPTANYLEADQGKNNVSNFVFYAEKVDYYGKYENIITDDKNPIEFDYSSLCINF